MDNYCVDVNGEYIKAKSKLFRFSLLFSLLLTVTIIADVLLVILAGEKFFVNCIISSVITVLFIWFAVFFISNIYSDLNARYRYFKGYQSGLQSTDEVIFIGKSDDLYFVNGLYVYSVFVRYVSTLGEQDKIIYTMNNLEYQPNDKLTITTYQRILVKAEKHL